MMADDGLLHAFLDQLREAGFAGDCSVDHATRLLNATDNSVYQILPQAVLAPKNTSDIQKIFRLAVQAPFHSLTFTPRGGGTGTNGQALNHGMIIDCSRYMNAILEVNLAEGWVKVQPGVVLTQLNDFLKPHGVFFAPHLSPGDRATIGGMVNTDACGKGSLVYGKTSDHIQEITAVYSDGTLHTSRAISQPILQSFLSQPGKLGTVYRTVQDVISQHAESIQQEFPPLTRFKTGYNLAHVTREKNTFNLNAVLTGSEGSLVTVTEVTCRVTPLPKYKRLCVLLYKDFHQALSQAKTLLAAHPACIETMNDTIVGLAYQGEETHLVEQYFFANHTLANAVNYVEFIAESITELEGKIQGLEALLKQSSNHLTYHLIDDEKEIAGLWHIRASSVGLLGKLPGGRKPVSGIEDTVVPPEHLPAFIKAFTKILDRHQLQYGMFGHIDAGCLHVRPALDLTNRSDEKLYHQLSDEICALTQSFGGIMWGEHGKGLRSEYVKAFFSPSLYQALRKIKGAFDPHYQLNPGKMAVPEQSNASLYSITAVKRGHFDSKVDLSLRQYYENVFACNGNGACFSYDRNKVMCPSYKVTRDRRYSPKGRAMLFRAWLQADALAFAQPSSRIKKIIYTFRRLFFNKPAALSALHKSMRECLGCGACHTQCPVNINIPELKSVVLNSHYRFSFRPVRDYVIAWSEFIAIWQGRLPKLFRHLLDNRVIRYFLAKGLGLIDAPRIPGFSLKQLCQQQAIRLVTVNELLSCSTSEKPLLIVQDWLTSAYNPHLVATYVRLCQGVGQSVCLLEPLTHGKSWLSLGFVSTFKKKSQHTHNKLLQLQEQGYVLLGIDPSLTLTYRQEYHRIFGGNVLKVQLMQEWLFARVDLFLNRINRKHRSPKKLLLHCMEQSQANRYASPWVQLFQKLGVPIKIMTVGCCGMAGSYGYEKGHLAYSKQLFQMSWEPVIEKGETILVTGFSCQSQVRRFAHCFVLHPAEYLLQLLEIEPN